MNGMHLGCSSQSYDDVLKTGALTLTEWFRLGLRFLRTFAGWPEGDRAARWPGMLASLRAVCARAQWTGPLLVMENHNHRGFVQTANDVEQILTEVGNPVLHLLLDTGNYLDGLPSIQRTEGDEASRTAVPRALAYVRTLLEV